MGAAVPSPAFYEEPETNSPTACATFTTGTCLARGRFYRQQTSDTIHCTYQKNISQQSMGEGDLECPVEHGTSCKPVSVCKVRVTACTFAGNAAAYDKIAHQAPRIHPHLQKRYAVYDYIDPMGHWLGKSRDRRSCDMTSTGIQGVGYQPAGHAGNPELNDVGRAHVVTPVYRLQELFPKNTDGMVSFGLSSITRVLRGTRNNKLIILLWETYRNDWKLAHRNDPG